MQMEFRESAAITKTENMQQKATSWNPPSSSSSSEDKLCLHINSETNYKKLIPPDVQYTGRVVPLESDQMLGYNPLDRGNTKQCIRNGKSIMLKSLSHGVVGGMPNACSKGAYMGASDGSVYTKQWAMNKKAHGFGWKQYRNGDVYEGTWKSDVPEGQGRYLWNVDGSEYEGHWKSGMMCGHGVVSWTNGDSYDGEWLNGVTNGRGIYTASDGTTFFGTRRNGYKHREAMLNQPCQMPPIENHLKKDMNDDDDDGSQTSHRQKVCSASQLPEEVKRLLGRDSILHELKVEMLDSASAVDKDQKPLEEKVRSLEKPLDCLSKVPSKKTYAMEGDRGSLSRVDGLTLSEEAGKNRILIRKERKQAGETIYRGHRSYDLMLKLQLGIRYSVGKVTPQQSRRLTHGDFSPKSTIKVRFPREGSQMTPPHPSDDFKWKDYCPMVFRKLREQFKIDAAEYMLSVCGNEGLRELSSPGKSGSVFYLSYDERYMVKTLRKSEVKVLLKMLPRYYKHVEKYENTLLTRFLGLHRVKPVGGRKVRFIVMGNVVSTDAQIHKRFDLKGSSHGRSTVKLDTDENTTLKDLDLEYVFQLEKQWRDAVCCQIAEDCKFLESERIMDYSLLLGLHFKEPLRKSVEKHDLPLHEVVFSRFLESNGDFVEIDMGLKRLSSRHLGFEQGAAGTLEIEKTSLKCAPLNKVAVGWMVHPEERLKIQIGSNMPARACCRIPNGGDNYYYDPNDASDVALYFGIIDILQTYNLGKKLEHAYKSMQFNSLSISAVNPTLYSRRFQHFMREIFQAV